jgi:hypothetical protein
MKIAVLISGLPRFCQEFDSLINILKDHDVDWYFYLWKKSFVDYHKAIADNWMDIDSNWATLKIKENLPKHHNLINLNLADLALLQLPTVSNPNLPLWEQTPVDRLWPMMTARYEVSLLKQKEEKENNKSYDLVIKGRNDVEIKNIDLNEIKNDLDQNSNLIFLETRNRHGYITPLINDLFLISNSKNIDICCDLINHVIQYYSDGVKFHSETLLATHFNKNNLTVIDKNFDLQFHHYGEWKSGTYYSNFGRWE